MSVVFAILAKDKAHVLPTYLACLRRQTVDPSQIHLYIRTNDNKDDTEEVLRRFVEEHGSAYASVHFDVSSVADRLKGYGHHEWNCDRFKILGSIRQASIQHAIDLGAHYFVADCDNFIEPHCLRAMLDVQELGVVAPLLRSRTLYSNYHADIDANGYMKDSPNYVPILERRIKGLIDVPVVHCTYFIHNRLLPVISYDDGSFRYEYVIFSAVLRSHNVPQYIDNRTDYGYLTFAETAEQFAAEG